MVGLLLVVGGGVAVLSAVGGAVGADARAQVIDPGLFAAEDDATRKILGFLSDFDAAGSPVLGRMLFVFNGGVLVLAGYLLVWHTVTGSVETAREGRWGFGAWEVIRIVTAVALMAPLPGGMNGAQHVVVSLAKLGGDFAHAVHHRVLARQETKSTFTSPRGRLLVATWRGCGSNSHPAGGILRKCTGCCL